MADLLTMSGLIRHFEERLRRQDRRGAGEAPGREPNFPMLTVFLGEEALRSFPAVAADLFRLWPQYREELCFLSVTRGETGPCFRLLRREGEETRAAPLTEAELGETVGGLFGIQNHFADHGQLLIYYLMDTSAFTAAEEFDAAHALLAETRRALDVGELDSRSLLILLLNEGLGLARRRVAGGIRNRLCTYFRRPDHCNGVLLLSSRRDDNAILEDWGPCCRIAAAVMALSNGGLTEKFFGGSILTASYACEEKPTRAIAQVMTSALLDELARQDSAAPPAPLEGRDAPAKLGLSREGTFAILDDYARASLLRLLPTAEQLELFPRRDDTQRDGVSQLSGRAFNDLTMNAWNVYLDGIVRQAREKVALDSARRDKWKDAYRETLWQSFSARELSWLGQHEGDVRALLSGGKEPSQEEAVLPAAERKLRILLSSDPELVAIFLDAIREQAQRANALLAAWEELRRSRQELFAVRDESVERFYRQKAQNYFDHHGAELAERFRALRSESGLADFLTAALDEMAESDPVFAAPFEQELARRLDAMGLPADVAAAIRQKLTGSSLRTYLQVSFSLGFPGVSAILMKTGTPLHASLSETLNHSTYDCGMYYYNTGRGDAAQALCLYQVQSNHLINDEGNHDQGKQVTE